MRLLASELWWVGLVVASAQVVRRGFSMWAAVAMAVVVDSTLTLLVVPDRPVWLWLLNLGVLSLAVQVATNVRIVGSFSELPDVLPSAPPTLPLLTLGNLLGDAGFRPVSEDAVLVGEPPTYLWVFLRDDGTTAELVHRDPHDPGFAFNTKLVPPAPGYDSIESVPWTGGWPPPTARRVALPGASWRDLLTSHDAALQEAYAEGARPMTVAPADALAKVLETDRAASRRVVASPWRSMLHAPRGRYRRTVSRGGR